MKISSYKEALQYLDSFIKPVIFAKIRPEDAALKDPLDRMRKLLDLLDNPQKKFKSVLVGGTSGKGSTSYLISHLLTTAGYKTGYTLSPHLQKVNERIQIGKSQNSLRLRSGRAKVKNYSSSESGVTPDESRSHSADSGLNSSRQDGYQTVTRQARTITILQPIFDGEFVEVLNRVIPAVEKMQRENFEPSHFEILIAMAFVYFAKEKVDIAVIEVGLGGRYDATNTVDPLVAVLTNVSLDHTAILGNTVEEIAGEKIGIIRKYQVLSSKYQVEKPIVVTGVKQESVIKIVEERCREVRAELFRLNRDFSFNINKIEQNGTYFDFKVYSSSLARSFTLSLPKSSHVRSNNKNVLLFKNVFLSLPGDFQVENASLAIQAVLQLRKFGFDITEKTIRKALSTAFVPGRFEIIYKRRRTTQNKTQNNAEGGVVPRDVQRGFAIVLDGAHNPEKMKALLHSLNAVFKNKKKVFVISFKEGKDISEMLEEIVPVADAIIITQFHAETYYGAGGATDVSSIKHQVLRIKGKAESTSEKFSVNGKGKVFEAKDSEEALEKALEIADKKSIIVVTGSLYFVGEMRDILSLQ